jgi:hypothetical protein
MYDLVAARALLESVQDLPEVHAHLDAARGQILAFTAYPRGVWRQIWSNNPTSGSTARSAAAPATGTDAGYPAPQGLRAICGICVRVKMPVLPELAWFNKCSIGTCNVSGW